jgi:predicted nucleic acid-binding protein
MEDAMKKRIYLDICSLKRPFDDQRQERVRHEAEAVAAIVERVEAGEAELVKSPALELENAGNPREDRRLAAALWIDGAAVAVSLTPAVEGRARELAKRGFGTLDALHVAFAEAAGAHVLATCDDRLLDLGRRHRADLQVPVVNPVELDPEGDRA